MKPLVLVHGFMGGSAQWRTQAALGDRRPLVALDLPGFGANAHLSPVDRIAGFAEWVLDTLTDQRIVTFDLLGHSMGGMIVQEIARMAPERVCKLVLYGTGPVGVLPGRFETIETSMERVRTEGPEIAARRIAATWFARGAADPEYAPCAAIAERAGAAAQIAGLAAMRDWSGLRGLRAIRNRTLIVWGDRDRSYDRAQVQTLWSEIRDSGLAVVPGRAHAVHLEDAGTFNGIVGSFLDRPE